MRVVRTARTQPRGAAFRALATALTAVAALTGLATAGCAPETDSRQRTATDRPERYTTGAAASLPPEVRRIRDRGYLRFGVKFDQPLMSLRDPRTGRVEGLDAEIGRLLALRIFGAAEDGRQIRFVETLTRQREEYVESDKVDVLASTLTMNAERRERLELAGPYYVAGQDILVLAKDQRIRSVRDLAGKRVCVAVGSNSVDGLREHAPEADISRPLDSYSDCARALRAGQYDAISTDNVILLGYVWKHPNVFRLVHSPFTSEPYGVAIRKGRLQLRDFINDTLAVAIANGDWEKAYQRSIGRVEPELPALPRVPG